MSFPLRHVSATWSHELYRRFPPGEPLATVQPMMLETANRYMSRCAKDCRVRTTNPGESLDGGWLRAHASIKDQVVEFRRSSQSVSPYYPQSPS